MTTIDPKEFRDINPGGRLDPYFLTIPVSATGSAGMETCLVNLVESGDEVVVSVNGGYIL
ncbi:MAG: hypothetical protein Q8N95_05965 [Desulfobacterales bacterium]|nr:hypothetical protein [Desulfobacterales bacterium]